MSEQAPTTPKLYTRDEVQDIVFAERKAERARIVETLRAVVRRHGKGDPDFFCAVLSTQLNFIEAGLG